LREEGLKTFIDAGLSTEFVGYEKLEAISEVKGLLGTDGTAVEQLTAGEIGRFIVGKTPFYAESGGQLGDTGEITWAGGSAEVISTSLEGDAIILHEINVKKGSLSVGQEIALLVKTETRHETAAHHSATHLLQAALVEILGKHVKQAGSLVGPGRLRFDFTHFSPLSQNEIEAVEEKVNARIRADLSVETRILAKDEAIRAGATALFGEKYTDEVRVVAIGNCSMELCGGTHAKSSGEIGLFKILSENGIASGIRRIEALAGRAAFQYVQQICRRDGEISRILNTREEDILEKLEALLLSQKNMEKQISELSTRIASSALDGFWEKTIEIAGIKVLAIVIALDSSKTLRDVGDKVRDTLQSGVAVLGGVIEGKAAILAVVTKDLTGRIQAGELVSRIASIVGGKGGGRADMAQAGGPFGDKISEAIASVPEIITALLNQ
ncbi:MAG: DHHA1 domain-containing protein, partial [Desulfoprunum sp.]|nr:DHHA1 domain-containing protein [Desulfoprunum sp.]